MVSDDHALASASVAHTEDRDAWRDTIARALEQLADDQREAFLLKHVEDLSYDEMHELTGASVSALKMRVLRARGFDDGVLARDRAYRWDALSNLMDNPSGDSFSYNADRTRLRQASGSGWSHSYQYDEAGYVTSRDGLEIVWTATGRVARVGPAALPLAEPTRCA